MSDAIFEITQNNFFYAQKIITDAIKTNINEFVKVTNPSGIIGQKIEIGELPWCIIAPSKAPLHSQEERGNKSVEEQFWDIDIVVPHQSEESMTELYAGYLAQKINDLLSNFNLGSGYVRSMKYAGRPELPNYTTTFAEFVMTFKVKKIVGD